MDSRFALLVAAGIALCGCSAGNGMQAPDLAPPPPGTASLTFAISKGVRAVRTAMDPPLKGTILGDVFVTSDTMLTGPKPGAIAAGSIKLENVDLTADGSMSVPWKSGPLMPVNHIFLGMFDINGNAAATGNRPDNGDPVTLPVYKFDVESGKETNFTVFFDLIYNM